jgi:hypothetical protein
MIWIMLAIVAIVLVLVAYGATKTLTVAAVIVCVALFGIAIVALRTYATGGCNTPKDRSGSDVASGLTTNERRA